jgi:hypothetical protein
MNYQGDPKFKPVSLELAKAIAHRVGVLWGEKKNEYDASRGPVCKVCDSPNREKIDRMLLAGAEARSMRLAAPDLVRYQLWQFLSHRDKHLMPFIAAEVKPEYESLMEMPYPSDGDALAKGWWYLMRTYALSQRAFHDGEVSVALNCLKEMRKVDVEMVLPRQELPADKTPLLGEPDPKPAADTFPNHDERLNRAFARSAAPKPEVSDAPIETESSRVTE